MSNNNSTNGGMGFASLLTIVFIVLKLCKVIDWSWLWVLSPIWISIGLVIVIAIILMIYTKISGGDINWRIRL